MFPWSGGDVNITGLQMRIWNPELLSDLLAMVHHATPGIQPQLPYPS